ncbi:MAG TPA: NmrA family NAD(P)-binding protein [Vicinamibacterales bacterium]
MSILVTGGTGTVGSAVVKELVARGADVRVLSRDPGKVSSAKGVAAVQGNLLEPETVNRVFNGIERVFLLNPVSQTESSEALMALTGMRRAGVKHVVYLSVHHVDRAPWLPHFGAKLGVEMAIKASGVPYTILRPNNFYQNDYWQKDPLTKYGVYAQPIGNTGVSRVDVRDIAEAAAIALTAAGHEGETYDLVGPDAVTGESTAATWSAALGRPIAYAGDLDAWEQQSLQFLPAWMVFDFRHMYAFFQEHGLKASEAAIARQTRLLGHAPRPFDAFARETAAMWSGARA